MLHIHNWETSIVGPLFWDIFVHQVTSSLLMFLSHRLFPSSSNTQKSMLMYWQLISLNRNRENFWQMKIKALQCFYGTWYCWKTSCICYLIFYLLYLPLSHITVIIIIIKLPLVCINGVGLIRLLEIKYIFINQFKFTQWERMQWIEERAFLSCKLLTKLDLLELLSSCLVYIHKIYWSRV